MPTPPLLSLSGAIGGLGGAASTTTTDPATGITSVNLFVPHVAPTAQDQTDAAAAAAAKGGNGTVMLAGPKIAVSVGNYPEYEEMKRKYGRAELGLTQYKEILNKLATDLPDLFIEDLKKAPTPGGKLQKVQTYINNLKKPEAFALSEKVLMQKYADIDAETTRKETLVNSLTPILGNIIERRNSTKKYDVLLRAYKEEKRLEDINAERKSRQSGKMQEAYRQYYELKTGGLTDRNQLRDLFQSYRQQRNQQEAFRRAIFEQNTSYLGGRDPYFEP